MSSASLRACSYTSSRCPWDRPRYPIALQDHRLLPVQVPADVLGGGAPGLVAPGISLHGVQVNPGPNVIMHVVSPQLEILMSSIVPPTFSLRRVSECDFKAKMWPGLLKCPLISSLADIMS